MDLQGDLREGEKVKNNSKIVHLRIRKNGIAFIGVGKDSGIAGFEMKIVGVWF